MLNSQLHDERSFYNAFIRDLEACRKEVIIESPFITSERMKTLWPTFTKLLNKGVKIYFITRDPKDRIKIIKEHGGNKLDIKGLWRYIQNPIYAGVSGEKWTSNQRIKAKFNELVSIETFNKANKGKVVISEENGQVKIYKKEAPEYLIKKGVRNPDFPYKKVVMCPHCEKPLFGSASRGRLGKYYPAYHCNKRGHYFRVSKDDLEGVVKRFVQNIRLAPKYAEELSSAVITEWDKRQLELNKDTVNIDSKLEELKTQVKLTIDKIKMLTSEVAIKYLEQDLIKLEQEMSDLVLEKEKTDQEKPTDARIVMAYIKYFLEHMDDLLLRGTNPLNKAGYFGVLFDKAPTYEEINSGTPQLANCISLNEAFIRGQGMLAAGLGVEPRINRSKVYCPTIRRPGNAK